jgi:membrane fusion protein (multidrug efflux system)
MPQPFERTVHAIDSDHSRGWIATLLLISAVVLVWVAWFTLSSVPLYIVSDTARIEVSQSAHPIEAALSGRVVETSLVVNREVRSGDVLVIFDSTQQQLELEEERVRLAALPPQLLHLREQLAAEEEGRLAAVESGERSIREGLEHHAESTASVDLAIKEHERAERLFAAGLLPELDIIRQRSELDRRRAAAAALQAAAGRREPEYRVRLGEQRARMARLRRDIADLEGHIAGGRGRVRRLEYEIRERRILAPAAGRIGEASALRVGAFVSAGDRVGAIVPTGTFAVVAQFLPPLAVGRLAEGQTGRVRLEAFPHLEFGTLRARVRTVASEVRNGVIRVELDAEALPGVPLQHGMTGVVEIETGRITPAALVMRRTSRWLSASRAAPPESGR